MRNNNDKVSLRSLKTPRLAATNLIAFIIAACGGGGGGGSSSPAPIPPSNSAPQAGADITVDININSVDATLNLSAPTDSDGDSLTISITSIPTSGILKKLDGTILADGDSLTSSELQELTFTPDENTDDVLIYEVSDGEAVDSRTINISINETPTSIDLTSTTVEENAVGIEIGVLSTSDPDAGDTFVYSLSGNDADSFEVVDSSLKFKQSVSADFENKTSYGFTLTTTDSGGLSTTRDITINVSDVNEIPTDINLTSTEITENSAGLEIGVLRTSDPDAGDTFSYTLSGDDAESFEVVGSSLKFKETATPNFENKSSYLINIKATDSGSLSFDESFTITLTDINEAPNSISLSNLLIDGGVDGVIVDTILVADEDAGDSYTLQLSGADAENFEIVDGQLKLKSGLSAEWLTKSYYQLTVQATDAAGSAFSQPITVKVVEPPFAPEFESASRFTMVEEKTKVFTVMATDLNGDTLSYSISGGTDASLFSIDSSTGELSFASAPDFESPNDFDADGAYQVNVRSSDGGLNTDQSITITVVKTIIQGTSLQDSLVGTSGNDYFKGNGGIDVIDGGAGFGDRLIVDLDSSNFTYVEKYGITILISNDSVANYSEVKMINTEEVEFPDLLWSAPTAIGNYFIGSFGKDDDLLGTEGVDIFDPSAGWNRLVGYQGDDVVVIWQKSEHFKILTKYGITKIIGSSDAGNYANQVITMLGVEKVSFTDIDVDIDVTDYGSLIYSYENETITGDADQNIYDVAGGDDTVDGNGGDDFVVIFASSTDFSYETIYGVTKLYGNGNSLIYGYDVITLTDVEVVEFVEDDLQWNPETAQYIGTTLHTMGPEIINGNSAQNVFEPGGGSDIIDGKGGNDYVILFGDESEFDVVTHFGITKVFGKSNSSFLYNGEVLTLTNVENLKFKDTLKGISTSSPYTVTTGTYGDDSLVGTSSDDYFDGINGNDFFNGASGNDHLLIFANGGAFTYQTQGTIAKLYGGADAGIYKDTVITLKSTEFINFLDFEWTVPYEEIDGNVITGSQWSERLIGTSGDDFFDPVSGEDYITGNGGTDTVWVFSNIENFFYSEVDGITKLTGKSTAGSYANNTMTLVDVDVVDFLDSAWDVPQASTSKNIILGSTGSEQITGTSDDDVIDTSGGDDFVDGGAGNDHVVLWKDFYTYDADGNQDDSQFYLEELEGIIKIWGLTGSGNYAGDLLTLTNVEKVTFEYAKTEVYNVVETAEKNYILGSASSEYLKGTDQDEYFDSAGNSDLIRGFAGEDAALFFLNSSNFNIQTLSGVTRISAKEDTFEYSGSTTYLLEIEKIIFTDKTIDIDTTIPDGFVLGSPSSNLLEGTAVDNIFDPWYGSDIIKGNGGTDSVLIFAERQYFDIETNDQGVTFLTGLSGSGNYYRSVMELNEISKIVFSDQEFSLINYQIVTSIETSYLDEGATTDLSIRLSAAPTSDVTVSFSGDRLTFQDGSTSVSSVTFTSTNWNTEQVITVTAEDDSITNASSSTNLSFSATTDDTNFTGTSPASIALEIKDGESQLHSISGTIWSDENQDGVKDSDESNQEGWTVYLDLNQNRLRDSDEPTTKTDSSGQYVFNDLDAGTYFVGVDLPLGWGQTKPASASTKSVSVGISEGGGGETTAVSNEANYHAAYQSIIGLSDFQNNSTFSKYDGTGSTIVIIDTGADLDHPHFGPDSDGDGIADKIVFSYDFYYGDSDATDFSGHGTHVAGTAAGMDKQYPGVAPGANLIVLKVFGDVKRGPADNIVEALKWVVENVEKYNIVSVNLSLGNSNYDTSPNAGYATQYFKALAQNGVIVVAASGNSYDWRFNDDQNDKNILGNDWDSLGVGYPSSDPWAFSIGNSFHSDIGGYRGLRTEADWIAYNSQRDDELTTIFSPGSAIVAADFEGGVAQLSGTSMASPIVAGAVAVIQQIAESLFGQRLTFGEMEKLFKDYGDKIFDVSHEDSDPLYHSGDEYSRLNLLKVAEALISLAGPGQYSATLSSGNDATNLDFGVTELEMNAPGETGILVGTYFAEMIPGTGNIDKIYGGSGNDEIYGYGGADIIFGGDGDDIIEGGAGADTLTGGKGRDTFKFLSLSELGDIITDFQGGADGDIFEVAVLLSSLGYNSNDAFADGWLKLEQVGSDTLFKLDKDGDGDNFDTLIATLKDFTLSSFNKENTDTGSAIPQDASFKSSYVQNTSLDSSFIGFDSISSQENSYNLDTVSGEFSMEGLIDLESGNEIKFTNDNIHTDSFQDLAFTTPKKEDFSYVPEIYEEEILVSFEIV